HLLIRAGSADVGQLFCAGDVYNEVAASAVFTYHLSLVHRVAWIDKEFTSVLQVVEAVRDGLTLLHCDKRAVYPPWYFTFVGLIFLEPVRRNGLPCRYVEEVISQPDNAAGRDQKLKDHPIAFGFHVDHLSLADGNRLNCFAGVAFGEVDCQLFHRLAFHTVDLLKDHLGLADLQFVSFATHGFNEHGKMQHAPAVHHETVGRARVADP